MRAKAKRPIMVQSKAGARRILPVYAGRAAAVQVTVAMEDMMTGALAAGVGSEKTQDCYI